MEFDKFDNSSELLSTFLSFLEENGNTKATVESYHGDATRFVSYLNKAGIPIGSVDPDIVAHYRSTLQTGGLGPNSIRRSVISIRTFYRYLAKHNFVRESSLEFAPIPHRLDNLVKPLADADLNKLYEVSDHQLPGIKAARDRIILSLLSREGLKVNELVGLRWSDHLDSGSGPGQLLIGGTKTRSISIDNKTNVELLSYRDCYFNFAGLPFAPSTSRPMFLGFKGKSTPTVLPRLTRHGVKFVLYELGKDAGLIAVNSEILRHCAIVRLMTRGLSVEDIKRHLGLRQSGIVGQMARSNPVLARQPDLTP